MLMTILVSLFAVAVITLIALPLFAAIVIDNESRKNDRR